MPVIGLRHLLHEKPVEPGLRLRVADAGKHRDSGVSHGGRVGEPERDPADIRFMDDVRRADFQRNREPDRCRDGGGLIGVGGNARSRTWDAIGVEHRCDLGQVEP